MTTEGTDKAAQTSNLHQTRAPYDMFRALVCHLLGPAQCQPEALTCSHHFCQTGESSSILCESEQDELP